MAKGALAGLASAQEIDNMAKLFAGLKIPAKPLEASVEKPKAVKSGVRNGSSAVTQGYGRRNKRTIR